MGGYGCFFLQGFILGGNVSYLWQPAENYLIIPSLVAARSFPTVFLSDSAIIFEGLQFLLDQPVEKDPNNSELVTLKFRG